MKELLDKAKINDSKIKSTVAKAVAQNLSSLAEPCFYPQLKKHYFEFLKYSGLTEKDAREFRKRYWFGRKESRFNLHQDPLSMLYIALMHYFLKKRDQTTYRYFMIFYVIRLYANLIRKQLKFCNQDTFNYTFQVLTKTHLFAREKTIANALYFLANAMIRRWTKGIQTNNKDQISLFIQDSRTRVSQSIKSFVSTYMRAAKEGAGIKTQELPPEDEDRPYELETPEKTHRLVDQVVKKITVYRFIDKKAQEEARKIAKINAILANTIVKGLIDTKYSDNIRLILQLFSKDLKRVTSLCGKDYYKYVRELMAIKRTKARIYFKQQVGILLVDVLKKSGQKNRYDKLTSQTKFLINLYLAYYLTTVMRNTVC